MVTKCVMVDLLMYNSRFQPTPTTSSFRRRENNHILPLAFAKRNHIRSLELNVSLLRDARRIHLGPVRALQIDKIRPHPAHRFAISILHLCESELDHRVLLATAGMIGGAIGDESLTPEEPAAALMQGHGGQERVAFEDKQAPLV
jgi:hypothetical protein